jgi:carbon-monoxide dehydrogenase small subunit
MIVPFELNGNMVYVESEAGERLVHILRNKFGLTSIKDGCLSGHCESCLVLINSVPVASCLVPVFQIRNSSIITLEKFSLTDEYSDIIQGFAEAGVTMCGYCNTGKIFTTQAILSENLRPANKTIREMLSLVMCRCTSFDDLVEGVKNAGNIRRKRLHVK